MTKCLFVFLGMICVLAPSTGFSAPAKFVGLTPCEHRPEIELRVDEGIVDFAKNNHGQKMYKLPLWNAENEIVGFVPYFFQTPSNAAEFSDLFLCTEDSKDYFYIKGDAATPKKWLKHTPAGVSPGPWLKKFAALKEALENDPGLGLIHEDEALVSVLTIPRGTQDGAQVVEVYFSVYDLAEEMTSNQGSFFLRIPKALLKR